jgi:hypothetical protein
MLKQDMLYDNKSNSKCITVSVELITVCSPVQDFIFLEFGSKVCEVILNPHINTLTTGHANLRFLRFCIKIMKDGWRKFAF